MLHSFPDKSTKLSSTSIHSAADFCEQRNILAVGIQTVEGCREVMDYQYKVVTSLCGVVTTLSETKHGWTNLVLQVYKHRVACTNMYKVAVHVVYRNTCSCDRYMMPAHALATHCIVSASSLLGRHS